MFEVGATEILLIIVVAVIVIGPKDMPLALRAAGRWIGKARRMSAHFRAGFDAMVREAEMEEMERNWKERNARIMAETPPAEAASAEAAPPPAASAEAALAPPEEPAVPGLPAAPAPRTAAD